MVNSGSNAKATWAQTGIAARPYGLCGCLVKSAAMIGSNAITPGATTVPTVNGTCWPLAVACAHGISPPVANDAAVNARIFFQFILYPYLRARFLSKNGGAGCTPWPLR